MQLLNLNYININMGTYVHLDLHFIFLKKNRPKQQMFMEIRSRNWGKGFKTLSLGREIWEM